MSGLAQTIRRFMKPESEYGNWYCDRQSGGADGQICLAQCQYRTDLQIELPLP